MIEKIRRHIANDKLSEAIKAIKSIELSKNESDAIILLERWFNDIDKKLQLNLVSNEEATREFNKIAKGLLKVVSDIESNVSSENLTDSKTISNKNQKNLSVVNSMPKIDPTKFHILVFNEKNEPINKASITLIADNNTHLSESTQSDGTAIFTIKIGRNYKLYFAHPDFPAYIDEKTDITKDVKLLIHSSINIGSVICKSTCDIPGLIGRLNPKLDTLSRTYLYAKNIAINGGLQQPVKFKLNEPLDLEDCEGVFMQLTVKDIQGEASLLEYIKPTE